MAFGVQGSYQTLESTYYLRLQSDGDSATITATLFDKADTLAFLNQSPLTKASAIVTTVTERSEQRLLSTKIDLRQDIEMADSAQPDITILTVQLLSAYVTNNLVPSNELAALIQTTRAALVAEAQEVAPEVPAHVPAVSVRKSTASREHIISLIDGRPYKTLKRHLATHGLTPDTYRERYGLPKSYPMVAADYSEQRRAVAQKLGLGQRGTAARMGGANAASAASAEAPAPQPADEAKPVARKVRPKAQAKAQPAAATDASASSVVAPAPVVDQPARRTKAATKSAPDTAPKAVKKGKAAPAPVSTKSANDAAVEPSRSRLSIRAGKKKVADQS